MKDAYYVLLKNGLSELKYSEYLHIPHEEKIDHTFSEKYLTFKNKLLNKTGQYYWKYVNTLTKKIAVIIIAFIIALSSLVSVDAIRERLLGFIYKNYSDYTEIEKEIEINNEKISEYYMLADVPEGFSVIMTNHSSGVLTTIWSNEKEQDIIYTQALKSAGTSFNSELGELSETIINNMPCLTFKSDTNYLCYWEFDKYRFELIYPIDLGERFMSKVVGRLIEYTYEDTN